MAQPSPAIGSETRNGTERAGRAPGLSALSPDSGPGLLAPGSPAPAPAHLHARPWRGFRPADPGFFLIRQAARPLTFMVTFPIAEGTSEALCPASLHFRCGRCGKQLAPGAPASV